MNECNIQINQRCVYSKLFFVNFFSQIKYQNGIFFPRHRMKGMFVPLGFQIKLKWFRRTFVFFQNKIIQLHYTRELCVCVLFFSLFGDVRWLVGIFHTKLCIFFFHFRLFRFSCHRVCSIYFWTCTGEVSFFFQSKFN